MLRSSLSASDRAIRESRGRRVSSATREAGRERLLLDFGWRFHLGNADDPTKDFGFGFEQSGNFQKTGNFLPASSIAFDDGDWKPVDLPHDWAVELPFQNDPALSSKGFYPLGRDYPATSVGWYRRVFELGPEDANKRITVEFDGAYRETLVVCNGFYVGRHSGGYDPFSFDVTGFVNPGGRNVLLVRVDATLSDGWFYEGAGIYRHVWLVKTNPIHLKKWGTFVAADVRAAEAALSVRTEVNNDGRTAANARVVSTILDPAGRPVAKDATAPAAIASQGEQTYEQKITVERPVLWSIEERNLYTLVTEIRAGGEVVDRYETPFGIRSLKFDPAQGFFLNGQHVKVKGTCNHQDHAGLGAALPDAVQYYRIRKLKEMGCNAIRTSHNPPTPELLDACDKLGMLVFDETRMMSSNPEGLSQFRNLVRRDRNRPERLHVVDGQRRAPGQYGTEGRADPDRDEASGDRRGWFAARVRSLLPARSELAGWRSATSLATTTWTRQAKAYHEAHPDRPVIGTETVSAVGTRGIYVTDPQKATSAPTIPTPRRDAPPPWAGGAFATAQPWLAGGFIWTGFDYRGEPSPYQWPNISSQYGIIDTCGFPKDTFYYYRSWWTDNPVLHVFPHWNWPGMEGKEIAVWAYSNLDRVELLLNGVSLGTQEVKKNLHPSWIVKYAPGRLEARGYEGDKVVMTAVRETTGPAAKLVVHADRKQVSADGVDVAMIAVEVQDAHGRVVPITDNEVTFTVTGAGKLIGAGNGDPTDHAPDKGSSRKAFSGLCMALVQSLKKDGEDHGRGRGAGTYPGSRDDRGQNGDAPAAGCNLGARGAARGGRNGVVAARASRGNASNPLLQFLVGRGSMVFSLRQGGNIWPEMWKAEKAGSLAAAMCRLQLKTAR